jgi:hypothetical protein
MTQVTPLARYTHHILLKREIAEAFLLLSSLGDTSL